MLKRRLLTSCAVLLIAALSGSGCSMQLRSRFDSYGNIDSASRQAPSASAATAVQVFYGTAPAGFSLRENELKVEAGYGHRILGTVAVLRDEGGCTTSRANKDVVIEHLRDEAYRNGGNAVIYVTSRISSKPTPQELCQEVKDHLEVGSGWVVVLGEPTPAQVPPPAPAAPAPAAPTAPAAPAAPAPTTPSVLGPATPTP